ncbi:winged helix-turn-helix domain-containing protein [Pseudoalteromonas luteoviolacea]|uniref:winged helix-turn-helix domain-containing protein n=1 Tax=Pseudoalteromonas luteoviolacea TaxID=43657 RepID=UPI001B38DA60
MKSESVLQKQFISLGFRVDGRTFSVENSAGERLKIRPKTCQLLLVLMENHQQILSKERLLSLVWPNVVVDEQVVFQSIKEIRQLFHPHDVIKTLPTQGYQWVAPVKSKANLNNISVKLTTAVVTACLLLGSITYLVLNDPQTRSELKSHAQAKLEGSVVILPTQNLIAGNGHDWVRLGFMDQLIQRLPSEPSFGVLQTDYVLEVINRAGLSLSSTSTKSPDVTGDVAAKGMFSDSEIQQIFTVSGAQLVVASRLMGTPHDYQLSYNLYWPQKTMQGAIFGTDTHVLLDEFSARIKRLVGSDVVLDSQGYHTDFYDEMMGRALELKLQGEYESAISLLQALVLQAPHNMTAHRVLIELLLSQAQFGQAENLLEKSIPIATSLGNHHELIRLRYLHALLAAMRQSFTLAVSRADEVIELAQQHRDWLYLAYSTDLKGHIAMKNTQFDTAHALYHEAKSYHQILRCPVGEATSWLNLAKLAKQRNAMERYNESLDNARYIAQTRALTSILNEINESEK